MILILSNFTFFNAYSNIIEVNTGDYVFLRVGTNAKRVKAHAPITQTKAIKAV